MNNIYSNQNNIITEKHISNIISLINNRKPNISLNLPQNKIIVKEYNKILIKNKKEEKKDYIIEFNDKVIIDNLTIEKGGIYIILGHNGSGKSTLLKILYNIIEFDKGEIDLDSEGFSNEICQKYMAYNPQNACFLRGTLEENFEFVYKYNKNKNLLSKDDFA